MFECLRSLDSSRWGLNKGYIYANETGEQMVGSR